jgi:hypothetical protein
MSYFFMAIVAGLGFKFVIDEILTPLSKKVGILNFRGSYKRLLFSLTLLALPFAMFLVNWPKTDLSKFYLGDWLAYDILSSAEPNALVLLVGDTALFNAQYVYYTSEDKQGKKLVKAGSLAFLEYRQQVGREYPELNFPEGFFTQEAPDSGKFVTVLINANVGKFPIYIRDVEPPIEGYKWVSVGLLKKLEKASQGQSFSGTLEELNESRFLNFRYKDFSQNLGYSNYVTTHLKDHYYNSLIGLAMEFLSAHLPLLRWSSGLPE